MKDIICLEKVQRRASKFMLSDFSSNYNATRLKNVKGIGIAKKSRNKNDSNNFYIKFMP